MAKYAFLCYLLLLFSCYETRKGCARGREIVSHHHVVEMKSLVPTSSCTTPLRGLAKRYGTPLVHNHGPCSPLAQGPQTRSSNQTFIRDQLRVRFLNSLQSNIPVTSNFGENARVSITEGSTGAGEFVVVVGLGTPKRDLTLIFDTGSGITWTQCQPCPSCYDQKDQFYDPSKSSTYSDPPCSTPVCNYSITYLDHSYSSGYYGRDTLTLTPSNVFPNFIFGCGQNNSPDFGTSAGILGLAQDDASLISQTQDFAQIFCYCIPSTESSAGYLLFGLEALKVCQTTTSTKLLQGNNRYLVSLVAITIGSKKLAVPSSQQTIIDSGTVITRVPSSIYTNLQAEFKSSMSKYPASKPPYPFSLDTCYDLTGVTEAMLPKMVLHFGGSTNIDLDPSAVVLRQSDSHVCFAFAANDKEDDLIIIGSVLQRKLNILYDVQNNKVEFGAGNC